MFVAIIVFAILISLSTSLQVLLNLAQSRWTQGGFFERITLTVTISRSCLQIKVLSTHVRKDIRNPFFKSHFLLFGRDYPLHTQSYSDYLISRVKVGLASVMDARNARSVVNHSGKSIKEGVNKPESEKRGWSDQTRSCLKTSENLFEM